MNQYKPTKLEDASSSADAIRTMSCTREIEMKKCGCIISPYPYCGKCSTSVACRAVIIILATIIVSCVVGWRLGSKFTITEREAPIILQEGKNEYKLLIDEGADDRR